MADDLFARAAEQLYAMDPSGFAAGRQALVAQARAAGDRLAAKQIAGLRRPTQSAWILNQLARSNPQLATEFADLGAQLRDAHQSLDGHQIRELTTQRRRLIDQTAQQAFTVAGNYTPSAALRDEVTATLGAILADSEVAASFAQGRLLKAEKLSGFGPTGAHLVSVPTAAALPKPARVTAHESSQARRRKAAVVAAQQVLEEAEQARDTAEDAKREARDTVRRAADQLADANRRHDDALLAARHAELLVKQAQQALNQARKAEPAG
jgi:hypothetical protein